MFTYCVELSPVLCSVITNRGFIAKKLKIHLFQPVCNSYSSTFDPYMLNAIMLYKWSYLLIYLLNFTNGLWDIYFVVQHEIVNTSYEGVDCTAELLAIQESSDVAIRPAESRQPSSEDMKGNDDNDVHINDEVLIPPLCIITTYLIFFGSNEDRM